MSEDGPKYVLPTLQGNWNFVINEFLKRMANGYVGESWKVLQAMYETLPPEIYDDSEIKKCYEEVETFINNGGSGNNSNYMSQCRTTQRQIGYLRLHLWPLFRLMYKALYDGDYLAKRFGIKTRETGVHKIGEKLNK